jgi:gliding motility-associated-like protein
MKTAIISITFLCIFLTKAWCQTNLLSELIACYPFNKSVNDASGRGNHGGTTGGFLVQDRFERDSAAYFFNGTSNYIELNPIDFKNNYFSISMWVNMASIPSAGESACFISVGSANGVQSISYVNSGNSEGFVAEGFIGEGKSLKCTGGPIAKTDSWYHLVFIKDEGSYNFYINGKLVSIIAAAGISPFYGNEIPRVVIGRRSAGQNTFTHGTLDDFHIYKRAITPNEVKLLFEGEKQPEIELKIDNENPCGGDNVNFEVKGATESANYRWRFDDKSKLTYLNKFELPTDQKPADYEINMSVEIVDDFTCFPQKPKKATNKIKVKVCSELTNLTIPNVFSPNDDGINDTWEIPNLDRIPEATITIYNRKGTIIFKSKGYNQPWDGTVNGSKLGASTFDYVISTNIKGEKMLVGAVLLVR